MIAMNVRPNNPNIKGGVIIISCTCYCFDCGYCNGCECKPRDYYIENICKDCDCEDCKPCFYCDCGYCSSCECEPSDYCTGNGNISEDCDCEDCKPCYCDDGGCCCDNNSGYVNSCGCENDCTCDSGCPCGNGCDYHILLNSDEEKGEILEGGLGGF